MKEIHTGKTWKTCLLTRALFQKIADSIMWWRDNFNFLVKSAYAFLLSEYLLGPPCDASTTKAFKILWAQNVPTNTQVIAWRLIWNRLQTRDELAKRGVLYGSHNLVCPLCLGLEETCHHLFIGYSVDIAVWHHLKD